MAVATVVGGTPKLFTMTPSATGSDATLNDMIIWPSAIAIIGAQDACASDCASGIETACTDMGFLRSDGDFRTMRPRKARETRLTLQRSKRTDPFPGIGTGISPPT